MPDRRSAFWGPLSSPPLLLLLLSGLQQVVASTSLLTHPLLIARAAGVDATAAASFVSLTLLACGAAALLQAHRFGPIGSGFLCWPNPTILYLTPSIAAAHAGGLPLVLGMTLFAALVEMALAPLMHRLRPIFPPEIAGIVVLLVGIASGAIGVRMIADAAPAAGASAGPIVAAVVALAAMVAMNIWGRNLLRIACVLFGIVIGVLVSLRFGPAAGATGSAAGTLPGPLFAWPQGSHPGWSFDAAFVVPFAIGALAAAIKTAGNVVILQNACEPRWVRADLRTVSGGVLADGLGTMLSSAIGGMGSNSSSTAAGLAVATGVHSRRVAAVIAAVCVLFGSSPLLAQLLLKVPSGVLGATLVFSAAYMIVQGVQIVSSRMLDARRTLVIGMGLLAGLSVELVPEMIRALPPAARAMLGTPLVFGTVVALAMNLVFRIGTTRSGRFRIEPPPADSERIEARLHELGAAWGARGDVIDRVAFGVAQAAEVLYDDGGAVGPIDVEASFDEFAIRVRMIWPGRPLEFPGQRPSPEEIIGSEDGARRLAGFLVRRVADRVSCDERDGRSTLTLRFEH